MAWRITSAFSDGGGLFLIYQQLLIANKQAEAATRQAETAAQQAAIANQNYQLAARASDRAVAQSNEEQIWRRAEYLATQIQEFNGDEIVKRITYLLDWELRRAMVNKVMILFVHDEDAKQRALQMRGLQEYFLENSFVILTDALQYHEHKDKFSESEMHIRDDFDWFFVKLGNFNHMILSGLFSYDELEVHLKYVLDLISGGKKNVSVKLTKAISQYAKHYDFNAVEALIQMRTEKRKTQGNS